MFNLTVETAHTFYVGANGWLVHNCNSGRIEAALDNTGKVHGKLPSRDEIYKTDKDELERFLSDLKISVKTRLAKTIELGSDSGHSARLIQEQHLIRFIERLLKDL